LNLKILERQLDCGGKILSSEVEKKKRPQSRELLTALWGLIVGGKGKGEGKAVPLQAWSGPEGSRKLRFPDFLTTAQDSGKVVSLTHRPHLPPGDTPGTHFC
jgi:hypothetical protein